MRKACSVATLALLALLVSGGVASAQYNRSTAFNRGGPPSFGPRNPSVSPYLGLLNSGNNGGVGYNYFTRVKPQQRATQAIRTLNRNLQGVQSQANFNTSQITQGQAAGGLAPQPEIGLGPTGHLVEYGSHTRYFGTNQQQQVRR